MHVQLNTDTHVQGVESLADWVREELTQRLARHRDQITRVEVHLSDLNAQRAGGDDKRCLIEARLAGRPPIAVDHQAGKVADAVFGAADKLLRALDTAQGRLRDANGRETIRGME
jgi:ribosome-associated translation inhibitor RaiA